MGLGKTLQAIAALRLLVESGHVRRALVIAPASLLNQWAQELDKWAPAMSRCIIRGQPQDRARQWRTESTLSIIGYETLRSEAEAGPRHPCRATEWDLLILDEASRIKNEHAAVHRACCSLSAQRRWALTGTPLENSIDDLLSMFRFLHIAVEDSAALRATLKSSMVRRRKEEVLKELPPLIVVDVPIELSPAHRVAYDEAETQGIVRLRELGPKVRVSHILELILRLKQLCNRDLTSGESPKADDIAQRLDVISKEDHKALVFSQFVDREFGIGFLTKRLKTFSPVRFDGTMNASERDKALRQFSGDPARRAILLSTRAGGVGLNLQCASYVFHFDRWWNPAVENQAEARSHRMGQSLPVTVYRYTCLNTIEERIELTLSRKRKLFSAVVDDELPEQLWSLTREELLALFGL